MTKKPFSKNRKSKNFEKFQHFQQKNQLLFDQKVIEKKSDFFRNFRTFSFFDFFGKYFCHRKKTFFWKIFSFCFVIISHAQSLQVASRNSPWAARGRGKRNPKIRENHDFSWFFMLLARCGSFAKVWQGQWTKDRQRKFLKCHKRFWFYYYSKKRFIELVLHTRILYRNSNGGKIRIFRFSDFFHAFG